jgi:hypothetical protein
MAKAADAAFGQKRTYLVAQLMIPTLPRLARAN